MSFYVNYLFSSEVLFLFECILIKDCHSTVITDSHLEVVVQLAYLFKKAGSLYENYWFSWRIVIPTCIFFHEAVPFYDSTCCQIITDLHKAVLFQFCIQLHRAVSFYGKYSFLSRSVFPICTQLHQAMSFYGNSCSQIITDSHKQVIFQLAYIFVKRCHSVITVAAK